MVNQFSTKGTKETQQRERIVFSTYGSKTTMYLQKNKTSMITLIHSKSNSRWIINLDIKAELQKLIHRKTPLDLKSGRFHKTQKH